MKTRRPKKLFDLNDFKQSDEISILSLFIWKYIIWKDIRIIKIKYKLFNSIKSPIINKEIRNIE